MANPEARGIRSPRITGRLARGRTIDQRRGAGQIRNRNDGTRTQHGLHPTGTGAKSAGVPLWWTAYNKIKHERATHCSSASLKNGLNAVAGLFVAFLHLYRDKAEHAELTPNPKLLRPDASCFRGVSTGAYEQGFSYDLT